MSHPFIDVLSQELHRRFRGDGETHSSKVLNVLHGLMKASNWIGKDSMGPDSGEAIHTLCEFYKSEDEMLTTELRDFHASFPATSTMKGMLKILRQQWTGYLSNTGGNDKNTCKIAYTIPVSRAMVERSFSKLKLVNNTLRSLCMEERISDKDIPLNHNEVISIYRDMAPRRSLLKRRKEEGRKDTRKEVTCS